MQKKRCRASLIINTLAAASWASLTCCSAIHRQKGTIGGSHVLMCSAKCHCSEYREKPTFIITVTGLDGENSPKHF